jgi:hypothetical protein
MCGRQQLPTSSNKHTINLTTNLSKPPTIKTQNKWTCLPSTVDNKLMARVPISIVPDLMEPNEVAHP